MKTKKPKCTERDEAVFTYEDFFPLIIRRRALTQQQAEAIGLLKAMMQYKDASAVAAGCQTPDSGASCLATQKAYDHLFMLMKVISYDKVNEIVQQWQTFAGEID